MTKPIINEDGIIEIKNGAHPLIDENKVVPTTLSIGKDFSLLIITGPNTGGKTVTLKTVGLLELMACSGLNIPADEKAVVFGDNKERLQELNRRYSNSAYLSGDNKETNPVFSEIVQTEHFECRMLFTTKVLDNGVNLKDKAIKHIIIE